MASVLDILVVNAEQDICDDTVFMNTSYIGIQDIPPFVSGT